MTTDWKKVGRYVLLTYGFSFGMIGLYLALGGRWVFPGALVIGTAYMFVPALATFVVQRIIYQQPVMGPFWVSLRLNKWFLPAWLLPPALAIAAFAVSLLFPGVTFDPAMTGMYERLGATLTPEQIAEMRLQMAMSPVHLFWLTLIQGLLAGITINAIAGFGEELGWRGLMLQSLRPLGFWRMSVLIGLVWGVWHAPIILLGHNYPDNRVAGAFMMIGWTILLSPIFSFITIKARSVIAAAIFHGTINGTAALSFMLLRGGTDLTIGILGLAGFVVLALANLVIFLYHPMDDVLETKAPE